MKISVDSEPDHRCLYARHGWAWVRVSLCPCMGRKNLSLAPFRQLPLRPRRPKKTTPSFSPRRSGPSLRRAAIPATPPRWRAAFGSILTKACPEGWRLRSRQSFLATRNKSILIAAVRQTGDLKMPPKGREADRQRNRRSNRMGETRRRVGLCGTDQAGRGAAHRGSGEGFPR